MEQRRCAVHVFIKVQVFHKSENPHVTMEKSKYRLFSYMQLKDKYREYRKIKNDQLLYNKQPVTYLK